MPGLDQSVPPPSFLQLDDDNQAIRPPPKRFKRSPLHRITPRKRKSFTRKPASQNTTLPGNDSAHIDSDIQALAAAVDTNSFRLQSHGRHNHQDRYRWAILYENQRGLTMFSTPYYSRLSLLPNDPLPFTMPSANRHRSKQPRINLSNYPLPDGSWQWASASWMVDMRGATGQVQHDGFEYNLLFRKRHWHAVSNLGSGAFVRRRRWLRLMVKPGRSDDKNHGCDSAVALSDEDVLSPLPIRYKPPLPMDPFVAHPRDIITGDSVEEDWKRCHNLLQRAGRDGRQLELWHHWLGLKHVNYISSVGKSTMQNPQKQWSKDNQPMPSEEAAHESKLAHVPLSDPPLEQIGAILQAHFHHIMSLFVYPESRTHFIELVTFAGLLPCLLHLIKAEDFSWLLRFLRFSSYFKILDYLSPKDAHVTTRFKYDDGDASALVSSPVDVDGIRA